MLGHAISLVSIPAVVGPVDGELLHDGVTMNLGHDRGCRDRQRAGITVDNPALWMLTLDGDGVEEEKIRPAFDLALLQGELHHAAVRWPDADAIDDERVQRSHGHMAGVLLDMAGKLLSLSGRQRLRVTHVIPETGKVA